MEEKDNSVGKPEEEESDQPEFEKISPEKLKKVLQEYEKWLVSHAKEGRPANFRRADLTGANLQKAYLQGADLQETILGEANLQEANLQRADLQRAYLGEANLQGANLQGAKIWGANFREANLQEANLWRADLQEANFGEANLQGANLQGANLQKANLGRSNLREAILQNADLSCAKGLQGGQLAGANVSGAKLPEDVAKFEEGLKVVEEASRNARKLFFAMLTACAYALLTIATTTDVRLLTNSASSPLPIIRTEIPIVWFYIVAPLILLCVYFYFHLYMQRLWEGLAELPAIFPDGRPLDKKAYPWLLTGLVRAHVFHLKENRPPLSRLQEWISVALGWWFMPVTLFFFWIRYIPRQGWFGTGLHIGLLVVAVWAGVLFYRLAVGTLSWKETELSLWKKPFKKIITYKRGVLAGILGLILFLLSLGTINGVPSNVFLRNDAKTWVPYVLEPIGLSPFANFRDKDVSTKPPNWSGKEEEITLVKGAPLRGRNLRYANAQGAFLVNADLQKANLYGAKLGWANLQGAKLQGAKLQEANLVAANLQKVNLTWANLQRADLNGAKLQDAILMATDLQEAKLFGANLQRADLRGVWSLTVKQLSKVKTLYEAALDPELMEQIKEKYPHLLENPEED